MATALNPLPGWSPPISSSGPQNQNVISYGQALGQSLGCDPYTGCPTTIQQPMSGQSLQSWLNPISSNASIATSPGTYAPSSGAPAAPTSYPWYNPGGVFTNCYNDPNAAGCFGGATTTGVLGKVTGVTGPSAAGAPSAFSFGRIAAFLLGLIGIAGAVYLFKE